ncbi:MAG: pilus assembly protein PilC [Candidatus Hydrogenedentota bacterium]
MPEYRYRAVDDKGSDVSGTMSEDSAVRVSAILEEQGLQVSSIEQVTETVPAPSRTGALSWDEVELLNQQLHAIVRSGLPLAPALKAISTELRSPRLQSVLESIRGSLEQGKSLEEALEPVADKLPPVYRASLVAGDKSGNLLAVLDHMCAYTGEMAEYRNRMQMALAYPALVVVVCALVLMLLLGIVVPQFGEIFQDFGAGLPALTRFWLDVSETLNYRYPNILIFVSILVIAWHFGMKFARGTANGPYYLDWIKLRVPGFGKAFRQGSLARFCRTLGILLRARVPLPEGLEIASATAENAVLSRAVSAATRHVQQGSSLAGAFDATGYFDGSFGWLLGLAEERNEVDDALFHLAETYEHGGQRTTRLLTSVVPPLLVVFLGMIVVSIIASIYLPMFSLADVISGQ